MAYAGPTPCLKARDPAHRLTATQVEVRCPCARAAAQNVHGPGPCRFHWLALGYFADAGLDWNGYPLFTRRAADPGSNENLRRKTPLLALQANRHGQEVGEEIG